jgi:hypothetical protein
MKRTYLFAGALLAAAGGCSGSTSGSAGQTPGSGPPGGSSAGTGGSLGGSFGSGGASGAFDAASDGPPVLPPETELESRYEVPLATGHFVWVANPASGRVALIEGATMEVRTIEAGNGPTYLAAVPGAADEDAVIVLNVLSDDATVLRARGTALTRQMIKGLAHGANSWSVSGDGRWAVAWTDARRIPGAPRTQSFQDITVIDLKAATTAKAATVLAVGYRPAALAFAADGARAFAVTQDGISVIELGDPAGPRLSKNVAVTADPNADADTRDVSITPNGRLAVIRQEGSADLVIVDLASGTRSALALGGAVTDVDLTSNGDRAVAVVRDLSLVVIVPLAAGVPSLEQLQRITIDGQVVGSVALTAGGDAAVLYSNATLDERLTVLTLGATPSFRIIKLHAPVLSAFAAPDGRHAVVLHRTAPADGAGMTGADGGARRDASTTPSPAPAFSLVPLDGERPARLQDTDVPPRAVAISPGSNRALITVLDEVNQSYGVYVGTFPTLEVKRYALASPPVAVGVVAAAERGFVAQKHPEGRITFISLTSGDARTLTGFELGARVVDWSQP